MKYPITAACLAIMGLVLAGCLSRPQTNDQPAIASVLAQKESAGANCAHILIEGQKIASVQLYGSQYLAAIRKIDVAGCPEPFRTAWSAYCATWEQKLKAENAQEDTLDLISMWKGEIGDLPATCRRLEAYDTEPAWQRCEQAAMESGIQTAPPPAR
ncbi:MAG TPA: hypothetical protein VK717_04065 [Opitutaceae bacterium]|nr:hypothetical protein [Opitutaceae bacterium]